LGQTTGNTKSLDSPWPELERSYHLPPYSILCVVLRHPHSNGFLVPRLPKRNPETISVWTPGILGAQTSNWDEV